MNPAVPISADTLCVHCQYNLRTRTPADRCPECGTPIADTLAHYRQHERSVTQPAMLRGAAWCFAVPSLLAFISFAGLALFKSRAAAANSDILIAWQAILQQGVHLVYAAGILGGTTMLCGSVSTLIARPGQRSALVLLSTLYAGLNLLLFVSVTTMLLRAGAPRFGGPGRAMFRAMFALSMVRNQRLAAAIVCTVMAASGYGMMLRLGRSIVSRRIVTMSHWIFPALLADGILSLAFYLALGTWHFSRNPFPYDSLFTVIDLCTAAVLTGLGIYWLAVERVIREKFAPRTTTPSLIAAGSPALPAPLKIDRFLQGRRANM